MAYADLLMHTQRLKKLYALCCKPVMDRFHISKTEVDVLLFLANNAPYDTAKDIVSLRGLSKSHVCQSVEALCEKGLLTTRHDAGDRRCIHLCLTPAARPVVDDARAAQAKFISVLYRGVTEKEQAALERLFAKLSANLQEGLSHGI